MHFIEIVVVPIVVAALTVVGALLGVMREGRRQSGRVKQTGDVAQRDLLDSIEEYMERAVRAEEKADKALRQEQECMARLKTLEEVMDELVGERDQRRPKS